MLVLAVAGDGDCYGEGGNHLIHAIRRNISVKLFVHDNQIYGLTKGQASPTSMEGMVTKNQPFGVLSEQLNPMVMAIALDCSFVARGYAGDQEHLKGLIKEAVNHKGFSLVDILQPCVTFNKVNTYAWYGQRVYHIEPDYNPEDRVQAFQKALEWGERIPIGVIYRNHRPTFEEKEVAENNAGILLSAHEFTKSGALCIQYLLFYEFKGPAFSFALYPYQFYLKIFIQAIASE
jgi:2-oxoglutarate ferredoxin oxidoreductase subunit beta